MGIIYLKLLHQYNQIINILFANSLDICFGIYSVSVSNVPSRSGGSITKGKNNQ